MRITLNGRVVANDDQWLYDWFGIEAFSPATVRQALADNPEGEDLELEDLPDVEGGGERYASLNYVPLSLWRELSVNRNQGGDSDADHT